MKMSPTLIEALTLMFLFKLWLFWLPNIFIVPLGEEENTKEVVILVTDGVKRWLFSCLGLRFVIRLCVCCKLWKMM